MAVRQESRFWEPGWGPQRRPEKRQGGVHVAGTEGGGGQGDSRGGGGSGVPGGQRQREGGEEHSDEPVLGGRWVQSLALGLRGVVAVVRVLRLLVLGWACGCQVGRPCGRHLVVEPSDGPAPVPRSSWGATVTAVSGLGCGH